jgi:Caspase domain
LLTSLFQATNSQSLARKPKLFVFQACKGGKKNAGALTPDDSSSVIIPTQSDFSFAYSTWQGEVSWRDPVNGSIYIQALCSVILEEGGRDMDWATILEHAMCKTIEEFNQNWPNYTQCPNHHSTLRGKVWFSPKNGQVIPIAPAPSGSQEDEQEVSLAVAGCSLDSSEKAIPSKLEQEEKKGYKSTGVE